MLDELVRLGHMYQIVTVAIVGAGMGIEALFITQDIGQIRKAYGPEADTILASCLTQRMFNVNDISTAKWVTRHMGECTVHAQQPAPRRQSLQRTVRR